MQAGRIKRKLAGMLLDLFGKGYLIDPNDLKVNKGASQFNDWCSWTGHATKDGLRYDFCSWSSMSELLKKGKISLVEGKIKYLGINEIA